jgi:hypothetical protein
MYEVWKEYISDQGAVVSALAGKYQTYDEASQFCKFARLAMGNTAKFTISGPGL